MRSPQSYLVVLEQLAAKAHIRFDRDAALEGVRAAFSASHSDPLEVLATAGRATGLGCRIVELPVRRAVDLIGSDTAVLTTSADEDWLLLVDRRGSRVAVAKFGSDDSSAWRSVEELERELEPEAGDEKSPSSPARRWVAVEPDLACSLAETETAADGSRTHLAPLTRLQRLFRPERSDILAVILFAVVVGGLLLATPIAVQTLVNIVAVGGALPPLLILSLLLLGALVAAAFLRAMQTWTVEILQRRVFVRMVADLAHRLPRVSFGVHDRQYAPELVNRFFDVMTIQKASSQLLVDGLSMVLSVIVGLVVLAFYHPILLAFDLVLLAAVALVVLGPARSGVRSAIAESKAKYAVACWLEEIARNPLTFKSPVGEEFVTHRADLLARDYVLERRRHYRVLFGQILASLSLQVVASTVLLGVGGLLVIAGELSLGQLVAAEIIVTVVVGSVSKMGKHIEGYYDLMAAVDKLGHLIDLPLEELGGIAKPAPSESVGARVRLDRLRVRGSDGRVLPGRVSFSIAPGERAALSRQDDRLTSAIAQVLYGVRTPHEGSAEIDGYDVRDLSVDDLRRDVAVVAKPEIFDGTIWENVTLDNPGLDGETVRSVLERLGLRQDFAALPDGLRTNLQPGGSPLSSDQATRVLLARAMARSPRLLVIDGALDGLTRSSLEKARDAVVDPAAPWTLLLISNRERVLASCDRRLELLEPVRALTATTGEDRDRD